MGRAALDGDFASFQEKVLGLNVDVQGLTMRYRSLRGETFSFGWDVSLVRDGAEVPLTGFKHYENPYCVAEFPASEMDIHVGDYVMRLAF